MAKLFILAGEPSGDLHGAYLIKELKKQQPDLQIDAWGGQKMKLAGANVLRSLDHLAFMGFIEVAKNAFTILENFKLCKKHIAELKPDIVIFIDYPGFNIRMAKWAKSRGYRTIQYIAPAAWAWKENRVKKIRKYIDQLLVILPFEKSFFAKHFIDAHFVGHPLIEEMKDWVPDQDFNLPKKQKYEKSIALFPGSRTQEIQHILPKMISFAKVNDKFQFYIVVPDHLSTHIYSDYLIGVNNVDLIKGGIYDLLSNVDLAIVSSGTATLEVALMNVPQVVCYQTNQFSFIIAKQLVKTKYISLVNLIAGKQVVRELIQDDFTINHLQQEIDHLLNDQNQKSMLEEYAIIRANLTNKSASNNAAKLILHSLTAS